MMRLPRTLWLYVLAELWRLLLVSAGVLVTVIAFAATLKPLADGKLQPVDAVRFMGYALPPMLAYALPFAACFAATMVYHRLATDNEAQAASAGGVSHRSLLTPAVATGLIAAGGLAALNEQIIPRFLRGMQELITQDVAKLLASSIDRGEAVNVGGVWVYAERAVRVEPAAGSPAFAQLVLLKPVILKTGGGGAVDLEGTAERADVWLTRSSGPDGTGAGVRVWVRPTNAIGFRRGSGLFENEQSPAIHFDAPDAFEDDPKFLTFGELRRLRDEPEMMNWIDRRRRALAAEIARERAVRGVGVALRESGTAVFRDASGQRVTLWAGGVSERVTGGTRVFEVVPAFAGSRIEARRERPGGSAVRVVAGSATLVPEAVDDAASDPIRFRLELREAQATGVSGDGAESVGSAVEKYTIAGLSAGAGELAGLLTRSSRELIAGPEVAEADASGPIRGLAADLDAKLAALSREILSKRHERMALSASCLIMVLTGAVTALRFSLRQPLTVYLWSFFPALVCVITIAGGQQLTHGSGPIGLLLLWGGVAGLGLFTAAQYAAVARH